MPAHNFVSLFWGVINLIICKEIGEVQNTECIHMWFDSAKTHEKEKIMKGMRHRWISFKYILF